MPSLPYGVKTLSEIDHINDSAVQIILLCILLEHMLRKVSDDNGSTFEDLIRIHEADFSVDAYEVHAARWVRNQIIHSSGKVTHKHLNRAQITLNVAVRDILGMVSTSDLTRMGLMPAKHVVSMASYA